MRPSAPAPSRYPDFFIVGAPKCGTTAIHRYLSRHPAVHMSRVKEPNFFNRDFRYQRAMVRNVDEYVSLFARAPEGAIAGEASALYLYSKVAIRQIVQTQRSAKLVAMLRSPLEAARSWHLQNLTALYEDIPEFENAWRAQPDRAAGKRVPPTCVDSSLLQYGAVFSYAVQLRRLLASVPRDQLHVIIFEEFFADPAAHYAALLRFLGVEPDGRTDFPPVYGARELRSTALAYLYLHPPELVRKLWRPLRGIGKSIGVHPTSFLKTVNERATKKEPLPPAFEAELREYFSNDISDLETILGRNLDLWRHSRGVAA